MYVYRISKAKYINDISGQGAKIYGGRWNRPGVSVLYTAQARSLAMLELLVHLNAYQALRHDFKFVKINIDESKIHMIDQALTGLNIHGANNEKLWGITDFYFSDSNILGIKVPSAIIENEFNYLLNPASNHYSEIVVESFENANIDGRFYDPKKA
ncbi:MAG: RES family NAD+ phosphorylase [Saprospiraceae bacterium]